MEQFKLKPRSLAQIIRSVLLNLAPMMVVIVAGIAALTLFRIEFPKNIQQNLPGIIGSGILVIGFMFYRGMSANNKIIKSYTLFIGYYAIRREMQLVTDINIPRTEIREIIKHKNGGFTVIGKSAENSINIPPEIENPEILEKLLSDYMEITIQTETPSTQYLAYVSYLMPGALMLVTFVSTNKFIVGICGTMVILYLSYSLYKIQMSIVLNNEMKKKSLYFLLVIASILFSMCYKLAA